MSDHGTNLLIITSFIYIFRFYSFFRACPPHFELTFSLTDPALLHLILFNPSHFKFNPFFLVQSLFSSSIPFFQFNPSFLVQFFFSSSIPLFKSNPLFQVQFLFSSLISIFQCNPAFLSSLSLLQVQSIVSSPIRLFKFNPSLQFQSLFKSNSSFQV